MKISKLFHWLYAVLMFLPLVMFLPSCLYYAFNDNAQAQEQIREEPIYYQSNEVVTSDDIIAGNIYYWTDNITDLTPLLNKDFGYVQPLFEYTLYNSNFNLNDNIRFFAGGATLVLQQNSEIIILVSRPLNVVFTSINQNNISLISSYFTYSNALYIKEYQEVTYTLSITDSINYAWNSIWNLPVFAWTQNSFVSAPFTYITGLFGLSSTNSLNYVFTYFCSISICWLVFDLIMYVPNLTHRWLDKGAIE